VPAQPVPTSGPHMPAQCARLSVPNTTPHHPLRKPRSRRRIDANAAQAGPGELADAASFAPLTAAGADLAPRGAIGAGARTLSRLGHAPVRRGQRRSDAGVSFSTRVGQAADDTGWAAADTQDLQAGDGTCAGRPVAFADAAPEVAGRSDLSRDARLIWRRPALRAETAPAIQALFVRLLEACYYTQPKAASVRTFAGRTRTLERGLSAGPAMAA